MRLPTFLTSAAQALTEMKKHGATNASLVGIVSSPEGVAAVEKQHPGTVIQIGRAHV